MSNIVLYNLCAAVKFSITLIWTLIYLINVTFGLILITNNFLLVKIKYCLYLVYYISYLQHISLNLFILIQMFL